MPWGVAAAVAGAVVSGVASNAAAKKSAAAADRASNAQTAQAYAAMDQQQAQFDRVRELLSPYTSAGEGALGQMQDLLGRNGWASQQGAINSLEASPQFTSLMQQGENAILQNASATGGLRGGNTQAALAQFRPQLLAQVINDQYSRLGGLANLGQNAAAGVGNSGQAVANNMSNLLGQVGSAQAGAALAGGRAAGQSINGIASGLGTLASQNWSGFGGLGGGNGITGTSGGNAGAYSTGLTLSNDFGGTPTYF